MKIYPMSAELLLSDRQTDRRADRGTDMTKLTVIFRECMCIYIYIYREREGGEAIIIIII